MRREFSLSCFPSPFRSARLVCLLGGAVVALSLCISAAAQQGGVAPQPVPQKPAPAQMKEDKSNMELVGFNDLQARSAYQPTIHQQGNRWIAYIGHHGGTSLNTLT